MTTTPDLPTEARAYSYVRVSDVRLWTVVLPELAREVEQLRRERARLERERDDARAEAAVLRDERRGRETP
jgi:hypothetical protein